LSCSHRKNEKERHTIKGPLHLLKGLGVKGSLEKLLHLGFSLRELKFQILDLLKVAALTLG